VLRPVQRQVGAHALDGRLEHLREADADRAQEIGVLGRGVRPLDQVHLEDRHTTP
jgi:hypothetical protein